MTDMLPVILAISGLLFLIFMGVPIAYAMLAVGIAGLTSVIGFEAALRITIKGSYEGLSSFLLTAAPFFILMGTFAYEADVCKGAFDSASKIFGRFPGGLAIATLLSCAGFAAVCGNASATSAAIGKVCLPEMERYKYHGGLAAGLVAIGGTVGILIPPSIMIIILAQIMGLSVGKSLIAGILPGLLVIFFYILPVVIIGIRWPHLMPPGPSSTIGEKIRSLKGLWGVALIFLVIFVGIYGGVFTTTEAATISAFVTFGLLVVKQRSMGIKMLLKSTWAGVMNCISITSMIFLLVISVKSFSLFLTMVGFQKYLGSLILGLNMTPLVIVVLILLIHIPLGMFLDGLSMSLLSLPIFFPVIKALGFPEIVFLILMVRVVEIGAITPPVGINLFVVKGLVPRLSLNSIFKGTIPFLAADVVSIALLLIFPQITMFLPNRM